MNKRIIPFLFLICLGVGTNLARATVWAEEDTQQAFWDDLDSYITLGLQSGYIKGHTTYRISFTGGESELEFPLRNSLLGIQMGLTLRNPDTDKPVCRPGRYDKARLTLKWFTNISGGAGKMKDSDWIEDDVGYINWYYDYEDDGLINGSQSPPFTPWNNPGKDIYSESDAELDASIFDLNYIWNFFPIKNITVGAMLGYRHQKFAYDIRDLEQVGYGPYGPSTEFDHSASVSGLVLTYKVKYKFTYIGLNTDILVGERLRLNLQAGYSGEVKARDVDDHILRYKLSKGSCQGDAFLININANWELSERWSFQISNEYMDINTKGTQDQYWYGDDPASPGYDDTGDAITGIPDKITSSFLMVSIGIKYRF